MEYIEELVELFRRSGGKFENSALGYRKNDGFYAYTLDSNKDTIISCPAHLLVDIDDLEISEHGLFITNPGKYERDIEFLEKYFAFHFNKNMLERHFETKRQLDSLSSRELSLISMVYPQNHRWSGGIGELEFAKKQILNSHKIQYFGKKVIMPFVTFLNHAKDGIPYDINENGISVSGRFSDEVFAMYTMGDAIALADNYGFITDTRFAFSLGMRQVAPEGSQVAIHRNLQATQFNEGAPLPIIRKDFGTVNISWFPLYFERDPLYPAKVAQIVARETGLIAEIFLNAVFRFNLHALIPVAFQLRESANPYAQLLSSAAQRQLELIGATRAC
jgi:hypothetical protein